MFKFKDGRSRITSTPTVFFPSSALGRGHNDAYMDPDASRKPARRAVIKGPRIKHAERIGSPSAMLLTSAEVPRLAYLISMIDAKTKRPLTDIHGDVPGSRCCFWDRHPLDQSFLGCPIRYVTSRYRRRDEPTGPTGTAGTTGAADGPYYETDGLFCSFSCCLAWINDHSGQPEYAESALFLEDLYRSVHPTGDRLVSAPSWRLLQSYGGPWEIDTFRSQSSHMLFHDHGGVPSTHLVRLFEGHSIF